MSFLHCCALNPSALPYGITEWNRKHAYTPYYIRRIWQRFCQTMQLARLLQNSLLHRYPTAWGTGRARQEGSSGKEGGGGDSPFNLSLPVM